MSEYPKIIVLPQGFTDVVLVDENDQVLMTYEPVLVSRTARFGQPVSAIEIRPPGHRLPDIDRQLRAT
jgi:hypothetical protein